MPNSVKLHNSLSNYNKISTRPKKKKKTQQNNCFPLLSLEKGQKGRKIIISKCVNTQQTRPHFFYVGPTIKNMCFWMEAKRQEGFCKFKGKSEECENKFLKLKGGFG